MEYAAVLVHSAEKDDIALLRAQRHLPARFSSVETLSTWPVFQPEEGATVTLLSFPAGKGEDASISHKPSADKDYPWYNAGHVTCFNSTSGQGFWYLYILRWILGWFITPCHSKQS